VREETTQKTHDNTQAHRPGEEESADTVGPVTVFPGDVIQLEGESRCRLGFGIVPAEHGLNCAVKGVVRRGLTAGMLHPGYAASESNRLWIDHATIRYHPQVDDMVIGTIVDKSTDWYRVDIGLHQNAIMSTLAFEGATKRNRPNLEVGQLIYCRVRATNKYMETELTCISPHFKKDWVTKESMFGELNGGYVFNASARLCRTLLDDNCLVLNEIGRVIPFEIAIGVNGRVWVNSASPVHTIIISNIISKSETLSSEGIVKYARTILSTLASSSE